MIDKKAWDDFETQITRGKRPGWLEEEEEKERKKEQNVCSTSSPAGVHFFHLFS